MQGLNEVPATVVGMSRQIARATILVAVSAVLAGCVPGLAADPRFATNSGARPQGAATKKPPPSGPPPIAAPKNDLPWHDCTAQVFNDAAVRPHRGRASWTARPTTPIWTSTAGPGL